MITKIDLGYGERAIEDRWLALAPAIHEAGHLLAARDFGFEVEWVSLDREFLATNQLAIKNECASGMPVCMTIAQPHVQPIYDRGCAVSRDEWELIRRYFVECLAGPMAEQRFNPHFQMQVAERDRAQANELLWHVTKPNKIKFRRMQKQFLADAFEYVEKNATIIRWLAFTLHNMRTIMRDEIDAAIEEARLTAMNSNEERMAA
jgi:hypothetical protein